MNAACVRGCLVSSVIAMPLFFIAQFCCCGDQYSNPPAARRWALFSTVSDDELLAVVTVNILFSEDVG